MDRDRISLTPALAFLIAAASGVIVVAGLRAANPIVIPVLVAAFFAIVASPGVVWLQARGLPNWAAVIVVISLLGVLTVLVIAVVGASLTDFTRNLGVYEDRLRSFETDLAATLRRTGVMKWLVENEVIPSDWDTRLFDVQILIGLVGNVLAGLAGLFSNALLVLLILAFILLEGTAFTKRLEALPDDTDETVRRLRRIVADVRRYVALKTFVSLLTGGIVAVCLVLTGVDYALLLGLLAFLLNYIPNIGSLLAAVPAVVLALVQLGPGAAAITVVFYSVINGVIGNVVEPRVMGRGLGLSPLVVVLSLVFWGWVLGPVGMLVSVPLTMIVKVALEADPATHWLAACLGPMDRSAASQAVRGESDSSASPSPAS